MTPADLVLQHIALMESNHEHMGKQLGALKEFVKGLQAPAKTARPELPAFCEGIPDRMCALRSEDARIEKGSLVHPNRFLCRGCGAGSDDGITVAK